MQVVHRSTAAAVGTSEENSYWVSCRQQPGQGTGTSPDSKGIRIWNGSVVLWRVSMYEDDGGSEARSKIKGDRSYLPYIRRAADQFSIDMVLPMR